VTARKVYFRDIVTNENSSEILHPRTTSLEKKVRETRETVSSFDDRSPTPFQQSCYHF